jgi:hypothetical protein
MSIRLSIAPAPYYRRFAAGAIANAAIAAMLPAGARAYASGFVVLAEGTLTVTRLDGTSEALGTLPAEMIFPFPFSDVTAGTAEILVYRSVDTIDEAGA